MENEKLTILADNEEFNEKMKNAKTEQEAEAILKEYGIEPGEEDEELSEEQMDDVAGGVVRRNHVAVCPVCGKQGGRYATKAMADHRSFQMSAMHMRGFQYNPSPSVHGR